MSDVPDDVSAVLSDRAAVEGATLPELVRPEMSSMAAQVRQSNVVARAADRTGHLGLVQAVHAVHAGRRDHGA